MVSSPISAPTALPVPVVAERRAALSDRAAFALLASLAISFLAGSSAPTPLYGLYQARWGFSPIMTTMVFGTYALAVLGSLLTIGRLSDHLGRRPVLLVAVTLQAVTMLLFAHARGLSDLVLARVVQGISTGGAIGAIGAGLVDLDRPRGTVANAVAPMLGTATGGIASGLLVEYLPFPDKLVYALLGLVFVAQAVGVFLMAEPAQTRPGALASLKPQLSVPPQLRPAMLVAAPLLVAAWSFVGFYGSLGPALVKRLFGGGGVLLGGLSLFVMAGSGAVAVLLLRARQGRFMIVTGASALLVGVALTLLATHIASPLIFFLGTAAAGIGFGTGFQGAVRELVPNAPVQARAGVLSVIFIISYLAMGMPAIAAGFRVVHTHDLVGTAGELGASVAVLALLALAFALKLRVTNRGST